MEQKKKMSARRHKAIVKRRILIAKMALALILIIGISVIMVSCVKKLVSEKKTETKTASQEAATIQKEAKDLTIVVPGEKGSDDESVAANAMEERAGFAVDPSKPAGSSESTEEKVVYLTFDDGPSYNTPKVLDILDKYNAKATFFVTGADSNSHHLIKKAYDKGHTIGLHTYSHDYASVYASQEAYFQDLEKIGQAVKEQIGYVPCFIRFPGGSSNTISANYTSGIMTALTAAVQTRGYQYYDWNISCGDGGVNPADVLVNQANSVDYTNIVMLLHDSSGKESTVEALPRIMEHYKNKGYQFKALDRTTFDAHHGVSN